MLQVENLAAGYDRVKVLFDLSLSAGGGEVLVILGTNGAGKSTMLRSLSGLVKGCTGTIVLFDEDISGLPPWERVARGLAHVPEGRQIFPSMSVREHLDLARDMVNVASPTFGLDFVFGLFPRLEERANQAAGTMSGGEQQMLAIGRALMSDPKVLMLDEPSHGLAPVVVEQLGDKIAQIAKLIPVLLVEQNLALPRAVASKYVVLENGHLTQAGQAADLSSQGLVERAYFGGQGGPITEAPTHEQDEQAERH